MTNRSTLIGLVALTAIALVAARVDARPSCAELLAGNAYRCQVRTAPDAAPSERCLDFREDATGLAAGSLACTCTPRGNLAAVVFGAGTELVCVGREYVASGDGEVAVTSMLAGAATRTGIRRGFTFREGDLRIEAFECTLDPACATPE